MGYNHIFLVYYPVFGQQFSHTYAHTHFEMILGHLDYFGGYV